MIHFLSTETYLNFYLCAQDRMILEYHYKRLKNLNEGFLGTVKILDSTSVFWKLYPEGENIRISNYSEYGFAFEDVINVINEIVFECKFYFNSFWLVEKIV